MFFTARPRPLAIGVSLALVRMAARLAPGSERGTWLNEWEAEVVHRWRELEAGSRLGPRDSFGLVRRSAGAFLHAVWLRADEWRYEIVSQDIRYAFRSLAKRPLFTLVILATIALGVGATTAIFSVLNAVVLSPLPYEDPDGLVMVWEHNIPRDNPTNVVSGHNFLTWREQNRSFVDLAGMTWFSASLTGDGEPERVGAVAVNASFWTLLGVRPAAGRAFLPEEDADGAAERPILLSYGFWQRRFGGDEAVLGRSLTLNGSEVIVIGVLPRGFRMDLPFSFNATGTQDVWMPQQWGEDLREAYGRWIQVLGRLNPGVNLEQAQAEMSALASRQELENPEINAGWTVNVVPLHTQMVGEARTPLLILFGAVGFVLLIACANVANLLLARATGRQNEIAVRTALGANRLRLVRQLLTESSILAVGGGALGLLLAVLGIRTMIALAPDIPRLEEVSLDTSVVLFALAVSILTGLIFGLAPALRASRPDLAGSLKEGGARAGSGSALLRARSGLVVAEVALSLILLVGSGLLIRSFSRMQDVGVGFDTSGFVTAELQLPGQAYPENDQRVSFFERLVDQVKAMPGVTEASAITFLPLAGSGSATSFWADDRPIPEPGQLPVADIRWVHRDYHRTIGIPLLAGRFFDERDHPDAPLRIVVSQTLVDELWPEEDPLGKTITMPWGEDMVGEIIGVAGDVRHDGPSTEPRAKIYWHHVQFQSFNQMTIVARTDGDPIALVGSLRGEVRAMDPDLPLYNVRTLNSWMADVLAANRFTMLALGLFAAVALILASVGVYGVMSYSVSQRTREIGVRMALGASGAAVARQVVLRGLALVGIAIVVGGLGALLLARLMDSMVFEISTTDPLTFLAAAVSLAVVAVVACYWPAHRAGRVDPIEALRFE